MTTASQPLYRALIPDQTDTSLKLALLNGKTNASEDYSSNGNDGVDTDIDHEEWGATFDGVSSTIDIANDASMNSGTGAFTVEMWINPRVAPAGDDRLMSRDGNTLEIALTAGAAVEIFDDVTGWLVSSLTAPAAKWSYVVVTYQGSGADYIIYVDSVPDTVTGGAPNISGAISLGKRQIAATNYFDGRMAGVTIYSEAKDVDWIKEEFEKGVPDSSLVLSMQGDIVDESVYRNEFTAIADAIVGDGYELNGSTDYMSLPTADWRSGDSAGTIMGWINRASIGAIHGIFASADTGSDLYSAKLIVSSANALTWSVFNNGWVAEICETTPSITIADRWYFVAVTSTGSSFKLYVNGVSVPFSITQGSDNGGWLVDVSLRDVVSIGARQRGTTDSFFNGEIDDLKVFSRAWTADEIAEYCADTEIFY